MLFLLYLSIFYILSAFFIISIFLDLGKHPLAFGLLPIALAMSAAWPITIPLGVYLWASGSLGK